MPEIAEQIRTVLPEHEVRMFEEILIHAPPARVFDVFAGLRVDDVRLAKFLGAIRTLGRSRASSKENPLLKDDAQRFGWIPLFEEPGHELIVGLVGQVWQGDFGVAQVTDREAFVRFAEPGYAKIAVSYRFEPSGADTRFVSETRVHTTDPRAARKFRWYWRAIRVGASLTVKSALRTTKRLAEA